MADRNTVQEIKNTISILDVVQPYVKLVRAGRNWKGISPFTKEKTPSFFVSPERGTYYCFSSGQGGDMFTFIEKMEGVDFMGALRILAEKAGVVVRYEHNDKNRKHSDRLLEALAHAEQFFVEQLTPETSAYRYATDRGLSEKTIETWRLGFAPDGWRGLLDSLTKQGFTNKELLEAGLIKESERKSQTWYDRFRNRLMFPIRDSAGRTIAFTGRALSPDEVAKYLNSPETELFQKSKTIFGMDRAKDAIRIRRFALLVEGQIDVLHCHQVGFTNAVALSGTALSNEHISFIKRYTDNLMLVLDSDRAGLAATARSTDIALSSGMRVKAVQLPDGQDPAESIVANKKDFSARVASAKSVIEFFLSVFSLQEPDQHRLLLLVQQTVLPLVARIKSPLEREHFISIIARSLAVSPDAVRETVSKTTLVTIPQQQKKVLPETILDESGSDVLVRYAQTLSAIVASYPNTPLAQNVKNGYAQLVEAPLPEASERAIFEVELAFGEEPGEHDADELIRSFARVVLERQYSEELTVLRRAQAQQDTEVEKQAEMNCATLLKRIASYL